MKQQIVFIIIALFLMSCDPVQRSVGFTTWSDDGSEYKFYLGTESSISVVKAFDAAAQAKIMTISVKFLQTLPLSRIKMGRLTQSRILLNLILIHQSIFYLV